MIELNSILISGRRDADQALIAAHHEPMSAVFSQPSNKGPMHHAQGLIAEAMYVGIVSPGFPSQSWSRSMP